MARTREQHFDPTTTPKRILALDGGGIRGVATLEYLDVIERMLAQRAGNADFRLCDYFDLIGGTSTGSIIAASLACGLSVAELKRLYRELGTAVFKGSWLRNGLLVTKFPSQPVQAALDAHLGADLTLGSERIRTGLMIMTKRLDTGSPWPLHNHPNAPYAKQNGELLLTHVVRASTAAPTYFEPEVITIASRAGAHVQAAFVDGGVSPFNDPALQMLQVAALQGHGFRWQTGADKLLLVSIGTGTHRQTYTTAQVMKMTPIEQGLRGLQSLMDDCARANQAMLQWLTDCRTPWTIDRAVGDMKADSAGGPRLATYARYNLLLEPTWLASEIGAECSPAKVAELAQMDNPATMDELAGLAATAAARQVRDEHFAAQFDVRG